MSRNRHGAGWPAMALAAALLAGCGTAPLGGAQTTAVKPSAGPAGGGTVPSGELASVPDVPVPEGTRMDVERTLLFGGDPWFGQLTLLSDYEPHVLFDFYRARLPGYGWRELTSVRAPTSVLTFDKEDRVLGLQITAGGALRPTETILTVSPRSDGSRPPPPPGPVESRPLTIPSN